MHIGALFVSISSNKTQKDLMQEEKSVIGGICSSRDTPVKHHDDPFPGKKIFQLGLPTDFGVNGRKKCCI